MIQIYQKDLKEFRKSQWLKQKKKCAVTKKPLAFEESVVDHKHISRKEEVGDDGKGMIRGVLHFKVNSLEGKIANAYKRYGLNKIAPLPEILRGLANYLENPPIKDCIHPSCAPKIKKKNLTKTDIKLVQKYWSRIYPKRKFPEIPKTKTKVWEGYILKAKELKNDTIKTKKTRKRSVRS